MLNPVFFWGFPHFFQTRLNIANTGLSSNKQGGNGNVHNVTLRGQKLIINKIDGLSSI